MPSFYTLPTALGEAKIANAIALGTQVNISELALGDGGGRLPTPDSDRTGLVNERRRAPINRIEVDDENPGWIVVEQILPPDVGGWTIREVGLYDTEGTLIAYGNYPETYKPRLSEGSGRTQTIRFVMQVSDTAAVTLKVDPSVVLATRESVDDSIEAHAKSRNHPAATEADQGMIGLADNAEALAGADLLKAMPAKRVHEAFMQFGLGTEVAPAIADADVITRTGFYIYDVEALNTPSAGGVLCHHGRDGETAYMQGTQTVVSNQGAMFFRTRVNGVWNGWVEVADSNSVKSVFSSQLVGHAELPGGFIMQWFYKTNLANGDTVTYPFSFPNSSEGFASFTRGSLPSSSQAHLAIDPATVTPGGFQVRVDTIVGTNDYTNGFFIVIGR